jgi:hypothetical protein
VAYTGTPPKSTRRSPEPSGISAPGVHEALLDAADFEDLPGRWQAAILKAEQNRPKLRLISSD